jgi:hypothetical protein
MRASGTTLSSAWACGDAKTHAHSNATKLAATFQHGQLPRGCITDAKNVLGINKTARARITFSSVDLAFTQEPTSEL